MRFLLTTTSLTTIILAATPAAAQTVSIGNERTTGIATSTASNGAPADIEITTAGAVRPASGTVAVTVDSNNSVKNDGTIEFKNVNNVVGIDVAAGVAGTITNNGKILLTEDYTPTDSDNDGDLDGPFATGTGRVGIRTRGALTGNIVNAGEIQIEGNQSAGILVGGPLTGALTSSGTVNVVGDESYGIRAGDVSGNVRVTGSVTVRGRDAVGAALDGDVGGSVVIQGTVSSTGYRNTTSPADPSKLDADDLLQGGPAVRIGGSVAGGILLDAPPANADPDDADEDDDGIPDAQEGTAAVSSYGAAPALLIGSADGDIAIGGVAGDGHGLVVRGGVGGFGVYADVDAVAISIGGLGHAVDLADGVRITGVVTATGRANATALRLGSGTIAPEIENSGSITATGGSRSGDTARAVLIEAGADVSSISNSGTISATTTTDGRAIAIQDLTGGVTSLVNSGNIAAIGAGADTGRAVAIDLSANTSGVELRQIAAAEGRAAPTISGNVLLGSGDDLFSVADGVVSGNVSFGAGDNAYALSGDAVHVGRVAFGAGDDSVTLAGTSRIEGAVDFGGGADTLTLGAGTTLRGGLVNSGAVTASVAGTLDANATGDFALGSLNVAGTGVIGVTIDAEAGEATRYVVAGNASFADGATVAVRLTGIAGSIGDYVIVDAGSLTGGDAIETVGASLPFLFKSEVSADQAAGTVTLSIDRKTATELGLNRSEASAYAAIFDVLDRDEDLTGLFLAIDNQESLRNRFGAFLPDHAGGSFESITLAARASARFLQDYLPPAAEGPGWTVFGQQIAWGGSKDVGDSAAYSIGGWGATAGVERSLGGAGNLGVSLGFALGRNANGDNDNEVLIGQYEAGVHWRARFGALSAFARGSFAKLDFDGQRRLYAPDLTRVAQASWGGTMATASAGLSYDIALGTRLRARPQIGIDYHRVSEDAWTDSGAGDGFNISVDERVSDEFAGHALLALGYEFGSLAPDGNWLRLELEGGRREILGGELGVTVARFEGGDAFTLTPDVRESGWLGRVRLAGGVDRFAVTGEFGVEEQQHVTALSGRLGLRIAW